MNLSISETIAGLQLLLIIPSIFIAGFISDSWSRINIKHMQTSILGRNRISKISKQMAVLFLFSSILYVCCGFVFITGSNSLKEPYNNIASWGAIFIFYLFTIILIFIIYYYLYKHTRFRLLDTNLILK